MKSNESFSCDDSSVSIKEKNAQRSKESSNTHEQKNEVFISLTSKLLQWHKIGNQGQLLTHSGKYLPLFAPHSGTDLISFIGCWKKNGPMIFWIFDKIGLNRNFIVMHSMFELSFILEKLLRKAVCHQNTSPLYLF